MTDNFIAFFYRERLLVAVVSLLIVAGGILALRRLNVDAFPDVTPVQVEIDTEAEGLGPDHYRHWSDLPLSNRRTWSEQSGVAHDPGLDCKAPTAHSPRRRRRA